MEQLYFLARIDRGLAQANAVAERLYLREFPDLGRIVPERRQPGLRVKRFTNIEGVARRKLRQLQIALGLSDLRVPPGNRLEALKGRRAGQHSIRVNDQYRVCFRWTSAGAEDVEIVDYH